jgi:hypothetical protein
MLWHAEHLQEVTTVITAIRTTTEPIVDRYRTTGTVVRQIGWKVLDPGADARRRDAKSEVADQALPATLAQGQPQNVTKIEAQKKKTRPPQRFTDATILTAMQTAGKSLDEKELSDAMKETGLGLPRVTAVLRWVLQDPGLAAAGLPLDPGRLRRRSGIVAPPRRRLGVPAPVPAAGSVRPPGLAAEQRRMAPLGQALTTLAACKRPAVAVAPSDRRVYRLGVRQSSEWA